jgi:ADP-heptose:LPS heptosyltransferase
MKRLIGTVRLATWGLGQLARHGRPRAVIHFAAGVGDELMLTAVIRELRRRGVPPLWVMSRRPELYRHNPDIAAVVPVDQRIIGLARRCGATLYEPRYGVPEASGNLRPPPAHMITCLMATARLTGRVRLQPVLNLTEAEKAAAAAWAGAIVIQPTVRAAVRPNELKEWWPDRWQAVVNALRGRHRFVQVGGDHDPLLEGVEDRRGHALSLREVAAMLHHARLFVGLESGLMHLSRAAGCPGVILFGGRVAPHQAGYAGFSNLTRTPHCSPCWRYTGCELDRQCMREITPDEVVAAINEAVARPRAPLPAMNVDLTPAEQARIAAALQS